MQVRVKVFATLTRQVAHNAVLSHLGPIRSGAPFVVTLSEGSAITDLAAALGLPSEAVHVAFVNARARPLDHALQNGDEVGLFPPIGGG